METSALLPKADFPDWLSPMLVKELRQGVRTRLFVSLFILLQVAMLLTVSLTLLVAAHGVDASPGTVFFWIMVGVPVLFILPLNGLTAVNGEIRANTLELIFLTRLTAFRIVAGKWLAIFVQSLLFVCAVLPYLVLRYFIGGVNLAAELEILGWMLLGSAVLSAFATGLSAYPLRTVRGVTILFFIFGFGLGTPLVRLFDGGVVAGAGPGPLDVLGLVLCAIIVLLLMLEIGAAKIAPPAENHTAVMRLLVAGGFLVALGANFFTRDTAITIIMFTMTVLMCLTGLCEEPRWIPSLFRPFVARGLLGRLTGRLFYPGWYTAVPFTLLVFGAFGYLLWREKLLETHLHCLRFVALLGTLLLPVALIRVILPGTKRAVPLFGAVQALSVAAAILVLVCDNTLGTALKEPACFLPLTALIVTVDGSPSLETTGLTAVSLTTAGSVALLVFAVVRAWGQARLAERESLQLSALPSPVPADATLA